MKIFDANITYEVEVFLKEYLKDVFTLELANQKMQEVCGIKYFFDTDNDLKTLSEFLTNIDTFVAAEPDRTEYGDFQTNTDLTNKVVDLLLSKDISPDVLIEPTCGKGNFIISSLSKFPTIKQIFAIEIYKPYIWETKFNIIHLFLIYPNINKPEITITHCSVFDYDFKALSMNLNKESVLILGNPPWVTNSQLGSLSSTNLPPKSNFKNQSGLDAITGKGNFDIAEYITMMLFEAFQKHNGFLSLLVKNSVVKNVVYDQKLNEFMINNIEKYCIDSKKEFNVSVEAAMLFCKLNSNPDSVCKEFDFYSTDFKYSFGWQNHKFVSNTLDYIETKIIDGSCPFVWRQGIKHDCSSIMDLNREGDFYVNKSSEKIELEEDLIYGFLKSSDLKNSVITNTRKYLIVTQKKVGQETSYIQVYYPKTYNYLLANLSSFQSRKSSIYIGKPLFSIFGIGDYSFKPYKVAISGLYKTFHFTLVLPQNNKPVMLDDTCYFIGFERIEFAVYAHILLNHKITEEFLKSITFSDAKRVFTKDLLMRLDMQKIAFLIDKIDLEEQILFMNEKYNIKISIFFWDEFIREMNPLKEKQMNLFN